MYFAYVEIMKKMKERTTENYKYLRILGSNTMKEKINAERKSKKGIYQKVKQFENKLCSRNQLKELNNWKVPFEVCSGSFLNWTKDFCIADKDNKKYKNILCFFSLFLFPEM